MNREQALGLTVAVVMGGPSSEREVSLRTGRAVADALTGLGYRVVELDLDAGFPGALRTSGAGLVYNALHGTFGEDGCVQGVLELLCVPYTGCGVAASALAMDKHLAKSLFRAAGIDTPAFVTLPAGGAVFEELPFPLPVVVKPRAEGSSVGVSIVRRAGEFAAAVAEAGSHGGEILIEEYVSGMEVNVGVLDDVALGAIEVVPAAEFGFYSYAAKYTAGTTGYFYPARLPDERYRSCLATGLAAHRALGCCGATRVDLLVTPDGRACVLEVNTLPGMTATSLLPKIAAGEGIPFPQLVERILLGARLHARG